MKKSLIITITLIICIIIIGITFASYIYLKDNVSYNTLLKSAEQNYEIDISISKEEEELSFFGEYNVSENKLLLTDDEERKINIYNNIYKNFLLYVKDARLKENQSVTVSINMREFLSKNPELTSIIPLEETMSCTFEIYDKKILSITCESENLLTIDIN